MSKDRTEQRQIKEGAPGINLRRGAAVNPLLPSYERSFVGGIMPKGRVARQLPHFDWQDEVAPLLWNRYQVLGWSQNLWDADWALLRRTCGERHPAEIGIKEMETHLLAAPAQASRSSYAARFKSLWRNLRALEIVPADHTPDLLLPNLRKPRGVPRPISKAEAELLMTQAREPMREWFILACLAGLRAMEVANLQGSWLERTIEGSALRITGKGNTEFTIPAHPLVEQVIENHRTLGRLWPISAGHLSEKACKEMKRLGVRGTFHACRHHFATHLLEISGGDLILVAEMMRHSNLNTTRGYAMLRQGRKREVLDQMFNEGVMMQVS